MTTLYKKINTIGFNFHWIIFQEETSLRLTNSFCKQSHEFVIRLEH